MRKTGLRVLDSALIEEIKLGAYEKKWRKKILFT
jgi:hypothetical protein